MNILYSSRFATDLKNVKDAAEKAEITSALLSMKSASRLIDIPNLKKLKGAKNAFRVKAGEYRLGFYLNQDTISLARCAKRKDIYRLFP